MKNARITFRRPITERVKKAIRRYLWVPIIATILHGCSQDECHSHNETTILLNRPTDGTVAGINELKKEPPTGVLISELLVDFVNETHAVSSSGGIPKNVQLTKIPSYCFSQFEKPAAAYTIVNSSADEGGVYIGSSPFSFYWLDTFTHELGHLQPGGSGDEAIPELNTLEQRLMGFALFAKQQGGYSQPIFFDPLNPSERTKLHTLLNFVYSNKSTSPDGSVAYDWAMAMYGDKYKSADLFFLLKLPALGGDFARLREETLQLLDSGELETEKKSVLKDAITQYSNYNFDPAMPEAYEAEADLKLMMAYFQELYRKFGLDVAMALYYNDSRMVPVGYTLGFEGMDCRLTNVALAGSETDCTNEDICKQTGAVLKTEVLAETLCCVEIDENDPSSFRKFIVEGKGTRYMWNHKNSLKLDGFSFIYVDSLAESTMTEIKIDEPCQ